MTYFEATHFGTRDKPWCLCTLDEVFEGHRHNCDVHILCGECIDDLLYEYRVENEYE